MAFVWNFKGMDQGGPSLQEAASQGMQGYVPNSAFVPQQQVPQAPVRFDAQGYGQGLDNASLLAEYQSNLARIAQLEAQLEQVNREWAAGAQKRQGAMMDDLDRKLAVSRANYGDISGAFNHLSRIDQRMQSRINKDANQLSQKDADRKELRNAYIMMAEASPAAQASWKGAIADMEAAYERKYGEKFEGLAIPTGDVKGATGVQNWAQFDNLLQQKKNSKGNLTQASIDEMKSILQNLPQGAEYNSRKEQLDAMKSQEKIDANATRFQRKVSAAKAKLLAGWSGQKVKKEIGKKPGSSTERTIDGIQFKITYAGTNPSNGKKVFEISRNGKLVGVREED